MSHLFFFR